MEYRNLGSSGAKISEIGLGSYLTIGMGIDAQTARDTFCAAIDVGINFIDTANAYNNGEAEKTLAVLMKEHRRSSLFLATKVFAPMGQGPNDAGLCAKHVFEQCHASLERLKTDYVDLYQCHRPVASTPVDETVRAMEDLARQGKILYWGTSEWPAWMINEACAVAEKTGARPPVSNQPRYSLMYRQPEAELFQFCRYRGIGNVVFSPLAHGILSGKYTSVKTPPKGTRAADDKLNSVMKAMYWKQDLIDISQKFKKIAQDIGVTAAQLAFAWTLLRPEVTSAIMGATSIEQVRDNAGGSGIKFPTDVIAKLDELMPGPAETYPLE